MRLFLRGFGVVLGMGIAAFSGACGGGDEGTSSSGGGPAGVPLSQLSSKYSAVFCGAIEQCFGPLSEIFNGANDCAAETQKSLDNDFIQRLNGYIAAGTVVYHADKVQACLDAIETSGCALVNGNTPDICDEALEGKVATGAMCNDGVECVGSDFCEFVNATCPGTCTARKAENADCSSNGDCMSGLACQFDSKQGKQICRTPAKVGEACKGPNAADCGAGSVCVGESPMMSGVCKAPSDVVVQGSGEACNPQDESLCQEGFSCAVDNLMQQTFKCVPNSASGGICVAGVPDPCPEGEYCNFDPMSADGICNKLPTDGQACVEMALMFGPNCAAGHICDGTKTCRLKQIIGGTCTEDDVCYSRTCDAGKCVVPPACTPN